MKIKKLRKALPRKDANNQNTLNSTLILQRKITKSKIYEIDEPQFDDELLLCRFK